MNKIGIDVSKDSVTVHLLEEYPKGGLIAHWNKTSQKLKSNYPKFYLYPEGESRKNPPPGLPEFVSFLLFNGVTDAAIEPTGLHYSHLWAKALESAAVNIRWVGHVQARTYRKGRQLFSKTDSADALALAAYLFDQEHLLESGELNPKYFLMHRPHPIDELRAACLYLEHSNKTSRVVGNYAQQLMTWQWPERKISNSNTKIEGNLPPLLAFLGEQPDRCTKQGWTRINNDYQKSVARSYDIEIDPYLREQARILAIVHDSDKRLEAELERLVDNPCFEVYHSIFDRFGFPLKIRANILTRIYPFESFLNDEGTEWIEYRVKEVEKREAAYSDTGRRVINKKGKTTKRCKINHSRDIFKMQLGMGSVLKQSGDYWHENKAGSSSARVTLWRFSRSMVEVRDKLPDTDLANELIAYCDKLKFDEDGNRRKGLIPKAVTTKISAKVANMLYRELIRAIGNR